ncbi:hypothetical protein J3R30DRAFT_1137932 [Lentinula aciculospora]|uniref:DASH complex subunit ASK1 n=1 Tax=Lentinula aciculospora TaxID=153920 RepID=A0A9W8ZZE7_9AGAR|nr:hypothetical protein J3R30DRAFT_1137932 [Lentinula aciculospora]
MPDNRKPVPPNPPRWQPNPDPSTIEVPGLDASVSPQDQIEQIEQLITLKLQNIDENFAKIHHILSNRILPAVKRYSVGTEPVREAAKFWVSFYEQAAQIRIPTYEDYATVNEEEFSQQRESEHSEPSASQTGTDSTSSDEHYEHDHSIASTESSFAPGQAAFSSTPAASRLAHAPSSLTSDDASWSASLESPLVRLDRELKNFSQDANETETSIVSSTPTPTKLPPTIRQQEHSQRSLDKGKSRELPEPLLRNLLRNNIHSSVNASAGSLDAGPSVSPLRSKGKTPILKDLNPFLPPGSNPSKWNGLVDLHDASVMTPQRSKRFREPLSYRKPSSPVKTPDYDSDDDSFDGLPPGMSPPVMISPARPMRSRTSVKFGQTPRKDAAARITKDIVADVQGHRGGSRKPPQGLFPESSMSTISTPPSLSRYNNSTSSGMVTHSSLESLMRQVGLTDPMPGNLPRQDSRYEYSSANESGSLLHLPISENGPAHNQMASSHPYGADLALSTPIFNTSDDQFLTPTPHQYQHDPYYDDEDEDDDDDDIVNNTAHPSAAFLMASQSRHPMGDDSFDDDDDDSMVAGDGDGFNQGDLLAGDPNMLIPVHPFAQGVSIEDDSFDDSFDNDMGLGNPGGIMSEETLFGVPPAQREQRMAMEGYALMMHGGDLLGTAQLTEEIAKAADSPTPAVWNRR